MAFLVHFFIIIVRVDFACAHRPQTYQAASGAGQPGMDELMEGTRSVLSGEREVAENKIFAHPLPFNVIPHIDKFQENGYTKEEMKVTWETRKIMNLPDDFPVRYVRRVFFTAMRADDENPNSLTKIELSFFTDGYGGGGGLSNT